LSNFVAACGPRIDGYVSGPVYPDFVLWVNEPVVPEPLTSRGAANCTGWITTGIFTTWP
jgi:hypothetical protein